MMSSPCTLNQYSRLKLFFSSSGRIIAMICFSIFLWWTDNIFVHNVAEREEEQFWVNVFESIEIPRKYEHMLAIKFDLNLHINSYDHRMKYLMKRVSDWD